MSSYDAPTGRAEDSSPATPPPTAVPEPFEDSPARVGTIVWGLVVVALAALLIVSQLGIVALNGTYVLIGLMIGAGAALVIGGLLSARGRDKEAPTRKA
ncbi:hypothetical protein J2X01_003687 [Arthrobacter ginsengisoli]|uniref:DUF2530 domain-containing protein n=1 Tax=Arthrobacter ginsengisoli TaxID=1356565 RepID=A0ABU1UGR2_9MICC|nr:hypothetical protein [Arthrobacter ginsengisoli]MDR7084378.1 hypothetical protein [Arthrobacter ginsengisoli]